MRGVDLYTFSKLLGSKLLGPYSTEMTERYTHLAPNYLKNAVDTLAGGGKRHQNRHHSKFAFAKSLRACSSEG